jgi:hypothetical protein
MIITIDTEKDSAQRMRQAGEFLLKLAGDAPSAEPAPMEFGEDMLSLFDSHESVPERSEPTTKPRDDFRVHPY